MGHVGSTLGLREDPQPLSPPRVVGFKIRSQLVGQIILI